jgi:peptidoglycan hydrolase CwlO-like protein
MTNYLGRNVNLALLVIIIGVVIALVGTTVFFQRGLQNRTQAYESTSLTLSSCEIALTNYQEKYSEAQQKVNETSQDIRKYDQLYEQKTGELKDTQAQLAESQKQLVFEKLQKDKFREFYEAESRLTSQLNLTVQSQTSQINSLNSRLNTCNTKLSQCQAGG